MLISEAYSSYIENVLQLKGFSVRTEEGFELCSRITTEFFGDTHVHHLSVADVRKWHKHLQAKELSVNTIRGYLFSFKSVITHARLSGEDTIDPSLIVIPKRVQTVPKHVTAKEVEQIIKSIQPRRGCRQITVLRDRAIVSMLYGSGIRASELCSLDLKGWEERKATIIGKGGKPRLIFWDERTHKLLKRYIRAREDNSPAMFVSANGCRLTRHTLVVLFIRLKEVTGIEYLHAHTLRHSYATNLMQNGMHIYTLSRLMGHSSITTTSKYLNVSDPILESEYIRYF